MFTIGGLPPLVKNPDAVYEKTFRRLNLSASATQANFKIGKVEERNRAYYKKYPLDVQRVKGIAYFLASQQVTLPAGGTLSLLRLRQLGMHFGAHGKYFFNI